MGAGKMALHMHDDSNQAVLKSATWLRALGAYGREGGVAKSSYDMEPTSTTVAPFFLDGYPS